ncbi:MAG: AAA family ATPase, partial [Candidatus Aminicenantales bacterium]
KTIAVLGKGGTGKSTVAAMIIRWLSNQGIHSILAVDADSNVNLNQLLGIELKETVGAIREEMKILAADLPGGMTKQQFLEYKIQNSLVEKPQFDLLAMGRPEGPGCYCYANNLLRDILQTLSQNYEYVVIDNEAGMEHLSRRTTQKIDYLLIISDPFPRGIQTSGKISRLIKELETRVGQRHLILNRASSPVPESVKEIIQEEKLNLLGLIPEDKQILTRDQAGQPIWPILDSCPAFKALEKLMTGLNLK